MTWGHGRALQRCEVSCGLCFWEKTAALQHLLALRGAWTAGLGSLEHPWSAHLHCLIPQRSRDLMVTVLTSLSQSPFFALPMKCTSPGPIQQSITIFLNLLKKKKKKGITPCSEQPSNLQLLCVKTPRSSRLLIPAWRQIIWRGRSGTLGAAGLCAGCWQSPSPAQDDAGNKAPPKDHGCLPWAPAIQGCWRMEQGKHPKNAKKLLEKKRP